MYLRNAWYVAGWSNEINAQPIARTFLDEPVVLYRASDGAPVALEDRCCHRGMPLSLGEVVGANIRCEYHGLVFDGTKFVGVAATHGFVRSSPDGMTWTWQRAPTEEALNDIAYGPAGYIAVGEHGTLLSSPNGSAWSREPAGNLR